MKHTFSKTRTITISAVIAALYIALTYIGQGFAFGAYQVRFSTAIYAMTYLFPFAAVPLALANALSNGLIGTLGPADVIGGFAVGLVTAGAGALIRKYKLPMPLVIPPIILAPAFMVPLWLSVILELPYWPLVINIGIGQTVPAILGYVLIKALSRRKAADLYE